jgi:hypothetical protein
VYLTNLKIERLKLLEEFSLRFVDDDGAPRMWTVLVGENGRCKTSILRAIALAASGAARGNELADLASLPDRRVAEDLRIQATFDLDPHPKRTFPGAGPHTPTGLFSELTMPNGLTSMRGSSHYLFGGERLIPHTGRILGQSSTVVAPTSTPLDDVLFEIRGGNLPLWLVAGYGTTRVLPAAGAVSMERLSNPSTTRLASLFDRGMLIGTGFADLLESPRAFSRLLRSVLIGDGGVLPSEALDLELRGRGGIRSSKDLIEGSRFRLRSGTGEMSIPATWLSQGYQSTIAWIADLIGHLVLELGTDTDVPLSEVQGLVLIDEIDLHLHPRWQARLITSLKAALPRVQFVVTTHSPMVLPALRREEVVLLDIDEDGSVVPREPENSPMLQSGTEIYRDFFGMVGPEPAGLWVERQRYSFLVGNPRRTDEEQAEMERIRDRLRALDLDPGWEPVSRGSS